MNEKHGRVPAWLKADRVGAFTDGVLAIIITILVLGIEVPKEHDFSGEGVIAFLLKVEHDILVYLLSFLLIGVYWLLHHVMFHYVARVDRTLIFLNGAFMFVLSLAPFTTGLAGEYRTDPIARTVFGLTYVLAGIVFFVMWRYCTANAHLLNARIDPGVRRSVDRRILVAPGLSLLGIFVGMINFHLAAAVYVGIPIFYLRHWIADTAWRTATEKKPAGP